MTPTYYALWYQLDQSDNYLIWSSDDTDGVVTQPDGKIPSFQTLVHLDNYARTHHLSIASTEPILFDLDGVAAWLRRPLSTNIDCAACLAAWNLFTDCSTSVNSNFDADHKRTKPIYDKLFWGNNLPAVTPSGKQYIPIFADDERLFLQEILYNGFQLFRAHVTQS